MELQIFLLMSLEEKASAVWEQGTFLSVRIEGEHTLVLYHLKSFFAEVWYQPESDEVVLILGFTGIKPLEPYLELIELSWL